MAEPAPPAAAPAARLRAALGRMPLLAHIPPAAGAIAWVRYKSGPPSEQLAETLRTQKSTLIVPGTQFEMENHIRVGFGYSAEILERALARVDEALAEAKSHAAGSR